MKDQENLERFLKNAQVFVYGCDAGSLGIVINGVLIHLLNDTGDGDGTVYVIHGDYIQYPAPWPSKLVSVFMPEDYLDNNSSKITVGFRAYDICSEIICEVTGRRIAIEKVVGTKEFVVYVQ